MHSDSPPYTAGSILDLNGGAIVLHEWWATLVPTTWNSRDQTFTGLDWYTPHFDLEGVQDPELWPVPAKKIRKAVMLHAGPAPKLAGKRPLHRPGSIALLNGIAYTYCANSSFDKRLGYAVWWNPVEGIAPEDIEHHGTELVAGRL
ncbi:hypothetical protein [Arthrobacter pityocampae]|uniref:hypothetical protein n=1 Tax=Arthrobacter pityocampae TaxID=547334 RepID=UPI003736286F